MSSNIQAVLLLLSICSNVSPFKPETVLHPSTCSAITIKDLIYEEDGFIVMPSTIKLLPNWFLQLPKKLPKQAPDLRITSDPGSYIRKFIKDIKTNFQNVISTYHDQAEQNVTPGDCIDQDDLRYATVSMTKNIFLNDETKIGHTSLNAHWRKNIHCHYDTKLDVNGQVTELHIKPLSVNDFLCYVTPQYRAGIAKYSERGAAWLRVPNIAENQNVDEIIKFLLDSDSHTPELASQDLGQLFGNLKQLKGNPQQMYELMESEKIRSIYNNLLQELVSILYEMQSFGGKQRSLEPLQEILSPPKYSFLLPHILKNLLAFQAEFPGNRYRDDFLFEQMNHDLNAYLVGFDLDSMTLKLIFTLPNLKGSLPIGIEFEITTVKHAYQQERGYIEIDAIPAKKNVILKLDYRPFEGTSARFHSRELLAAIVNAPSAKIFPMDRRYCRQRAFASMIPNQQMFCNLKDMLIHDNILFEYEKVMCAYTLLLTIDSLPSHDLDQKITENCPTNLGFQPMSWATQQLKQYTSRGLLIVTDQSLIATDDHGVSHVIFNKTSDDDSSQCIYLERLKYRSITFGDRPAIVPPHKINTTVPTYPNGAVINVEYEKDILRWKEMICKFKDESCLPSQDYERQVLWKPRRVTELELEWYETMHLWIQEFIYQSDSILYAYFPSSVFWPVRTYALIPTYTFFIQQFDKRVVHKLTGYSFWPIVSFPLQILTEIVLFIVFDIVLMFLIILYVRVSSCLSHGRQNLKLIWSKVSGKKDATTYDIKKKSQHQKSNCKSKKSANNLAIKMTNPQTGEQTYKTTHQASPHSGKNNSLNNPQATQFSKQKTKLCTNKMESKGTLQKIKTNCENEEKMQSAEEMAVPAVEKDILNTPITCEVCGRVEDEEFTFVTCIKCKNDENMKVEERRMYCSKECCKDDWSRGHRKYHKQPKSAT